ncbi:hypothetical protein ALP72_01662 [Pseudomonas coronafaciens pv. coronafaciens]|uniref:hypothetical protein n=1 Tax=Pseudomonas syringae group TaxID=136849 RepID=UPI000425D95B|nr:MULTISPECIES: hypothetical protein [Pseudomonas syringae group]RMN31898.1 hypothetical protein ALQ61_00482 [Pseudomonas coronafaciens pv. zizaniae]RMP26970.1 hypothetical protein ALQ25_03717 [Pseudomonas coronafaciens pv. atropurpurea]RMS10959.1 hypothetical protein ALP72_01662 [Pseudomonas coronafaciens pv. coronafaciens]
MKFISGMTQIFYDETLSSWIFRSSLKTRSRPWLNDKFIPLAPAVFGGGALIESEDWDFDPNVALLHKTMPEFAYKFEYLSCIFFRSSGRVVGWRRRWWFCVQCMRADISAGQAPGWRKSWCYKDSVVCMIHCVDLQRLLVAPQFTRSWDAFVQSSHSINYDADWSNESFQRFRVVLIRRIHSWKKTKCERLQSLFDHLYDIFLLAPVYNGNHGQAHELFSGHRPALRHTLPNYMEGVRYGSELSSIKAKFGSLVLVGYLLEVLNERDIHFMTSKSARFRDWCTYNPDIFQAIQFGCASVEDCYTLKSFLGGLELLPAGNLEQAVRAYLVRFERIRPGISFEFFHGLGAVTPTM